MCYRFVLLPKDRETLQTSHATVEPDSPGPIYNITPTSHIWTVRHDPEGGRTQMLRLHWGLIPFWAKNAADSARLANARAETVAGKPSFREAFRKRRCLIPASGFYEWKTVGGAKFPWLFTRRDEAPFFFAGLWETWAPPGGAPLPSCTLITTEPNELMQPLHDRMPVILVGQTAERWLDQDCSNPEDLLPLLRPFPAPLMAARPVSRRVNNVRHDDPACLEPAAADPAPLELPGM